MILDIYIGDLYPQKYLTACQMTEEQQIERLLNTMEPKLTIGDSRLSSVVPLDVPSKNQINAPVGTQMPSSSRLAICETTDRRDAGSGEDVNKNEVS